MKQEIMTGEWYINGVPSGEGNLGKAKEALSIAGLCERARKTNCGIVTTIKNVPITIDCAGNIFYDNK